MTQKGRVSPFGDPRIKGCSPLPAAFRSVPRPSSPLSAKASTKCPYALDPKPAAAHREQTPRQRQPSLDRQLSTHLYPPGLPPAPAPRAKPSKESQAPNEDKAGKKPVAFLSTMSKNRGQR